MGRRAPDRTRTGDLSGSTRDSTSAQGAHSPSRVTFPVTVARSRIGLRAGRPIHWRILSYRSSLPTYKLKIPQRNARRVARFRCVTSRSRSSPYGLDFLGLIVCGLPVPGFKLRSRLPARGFAPFACAPFRGVSLLGKSAGPEPYRPASSVHTIVQEPPHLCSHIRRRRVIPSGLPCPTTAAFH